MFAGALRIMPGVYEGGSMSRCLKRAACVLLTIPALAGSAAAQVYSLSSDEMARYTPNNPYGRFADGRPQVPDELINTIREMGIEVEEAWGLLREHGYPNQYEANWKVLLPEKKLVGRAFTVQFMPTRKDLEEAMQKEAEAKGLGRLRNQTAIDMLQSNDVAVVDLYGKVEGGTFVGDKLAYYVNRTTGTGLVVDGGLFYLQRIFKTGMPAYYRGTHPGSLTNAMLTGINVPVRIGDAIVMPGDIVLGDRDGVLFIPPQLIEQVIESARNQRLRDEWVKKKFDTGKYKSGEIYGRPRDPELLREFEEFIKQKPPRPKPKPQD
jgi:4-hydroxy-4-methyl-2-oxoglutarate aldolase